MGAPKVVMYCTDWCPYCDRARSLLADKGVTVLEIDVDAVPGAREEMRARSGRDTVPQILSVRATSADPMTCRRSMRTGAWIHC